MFSPQTGTLDAKSFVFPPMCYSAELLLIFDYLRESKWEVSVLVVGVMVVGMNTVLINSSDYIFKNFFIVDSQIIHISN